MKKLLSIVLAALMAVSLFTACGAKSETAAPAESQAAASDSTSTETAAPASSEASSDATSYTIGICNYVDDASSTRSLKTSRPASPPSAKKKA